MQIKDNSIINNKLNIFNSHQIIKYTVYILLITYIVSPHAYADNKTLTFPNACLSGQKLVIAAVGDILLHKQLQISANLYGFEKFWQVAIPYFQNADIVFANLEGPIAPGVYRWDTDVRINNNVYSTFPYFNYPAHLAIELKNSGFTIVSTANNHALDRFSIGIDKTIAALDTAKLYFIGTRTKNKKNTFVNIVNKKGFKIAWIACIQDTNGNPDKYNQVLYCYNKEDRKWIIQTIQTLRSITDAIIVAPHWGEEYQHHPTEQQRQFAKQVLDAGALAVLGSHPHVLQPIEKYITKDNRATFIIYSLGNFISYQGMADRRSSIILLLGLTKTPANKTVINGIRFVPIYMQNRNGLSNIYLKILHKENPDSTIYEVISHIMPMGNAVYALPIVTNPECFNYSLSSLPITIALNYI